METTAKYHHVLFDLDHTLWDYESNSKQALKQIYAKHGLDKLDGLTCSLFEDRFFQVNETLWEKYDQQEITSEELRGSRFHLILEDFGMISDQLASDLSSDYLTLSPQNSAVMPYAFEILDYLKPKYGMHIITNGFHEIQYTKLTASGLSEYFGEIVTSEEAGARKPNRNIFYHTLELIGADPGQCIMIGDNLRTDIQGAINASIDHVFLQPAGNAS